MFSFIRRKFMAFADIFKDTNDINEKSVVGFASFAIMVVFAVVDIITGYLGKDLVINEFIYNSFLYIALGALGISEVGKIFGKRDTQSSGYISTYDNDKYIPNSEGYSVEDGYVGYDESVCTGDCCRRQ